MAPSLPSTRRRTMKRLLLTAVLGTIGLSLGQSTASAQVFVRAPFVRVQTGPGVWVRAPFVNLFVPPPPAYYVYPPPGTFVPPPPTGVAPTAPSPEVFPPPSVLKNPADATP